VKTQEYDKAEKRPPTGFLWVMQVGSEMQEELSEATLYKSYTAFSTEAT